MMFSLSFAVILLISFGVNGENNDINTLRGNNPEKGYAFGKLRLADEIGKNDEIIPAPVTEAPQLKQDQSGNSHPLPSPCLGTRTLTKLAHPKDKTKYVQCRDEFHYEIFSCPNGGEYNEQTNSCDLTITMVDVCGKEKPCLNEGQCTVLSNSSFKCACRPDWTGERCETPLNSCVKKPCGPNADCRQLKTSDYEQDYACVCHGTKGYGLNCQEVVPNPCLTSGEQFFPFAFSQRAYIQCDGELVYFQPCGPLLYWNQEEKICDRKRPPKIDLPALLAKMKTQFEKEKQDETSTTTTTTTTTPEPEIQTSFGQQGKDHEGMFAFVPARVGNRQQLQLQADLLHQQTVLTQHAREIEKKAQELANHLSQPMDGNQIRQEFVSKTQQLPNLDLEVTVKQPLTSQLGRNQLLSQNTQQQWKPSLTESSFVNSNFDQSQTQDNQQQQNQGFGNQKGFSHTSDTNSQDSARFVAHPQTSQGSRTFQSQIRFQDQKQQDPFETTPTSQNAVRLQGFQNSNIPEQEQTWQNKPINQFTESQSQQSTGSNKQNTQGFLTQPQSQLSFRTIQNQERLPEQSRQTFMETAPSTQTTFRLEGFESQNPQRQEQSWENKGTTQFTDSQSPSSISFNTQNTQKFVAQPQSWENKATTQFADSQLPSSNNFNTQNTQKFVAQPQSWQSSQTSQDQTRLTDQNSRTFTETAPSTQTTFRLEGFESQNPRKQEQSWQNKPTDQFTGSQSSSSSTGFNTQNPQGFISQPQSQQSQQTFTETAPSTQTTFRLEGFESQNPRKQEQSRQNKGTTQFTDSQSPSSTSFNTQKFVAQPQSWQSSQTIPNQGRLTEQSEQAFMETTTPTQIGVRFQGFESQNPRGQEQSWQSKGTTQFTDSQSPSLTSFNTQNTQKFGAQPQSWQSSQTIQNQGRLTDQNQQTFVETTTPSPTVIRLQGFQNQNPRESQPSWQSKPTTQFTGSQLPETSSFNTQNSQTFSAQSQSDQDSQSFQTPQKFTSTIPEGSSADTKNRLISRLQQTNRFGLEQPTVQKQQPWQIKGNTQFQQNIAQPEASSIDNQRLPLSNDNTFVSQSTQSQQGFNQIPDTKTQSNTRFVSQPQSWQESQTIQNQQPILETTTTAQNIGRFSGYQTQKSQDQDQSWQTKLPNQQIQSEPIKPKTSQIIAFQPKWPETPKLNQQDNILTPPTFSTNTNQQPLITKPSSQIPTTQYGYNQQQKGLPIQSSFEQNQPRLNNQQFQSQESQLTDSDDFKTQTGQSFVARPVGSFQSQPLSQTGQLVANSYDTPTFGTKATTYQTQQNPSPIVQSNEQRKPLDSLSTSLSGSWRPRSY